MRVHLGCDHAGFELKTHVVEWLSTHGYEPVDHGASSYDADDDYPPYCLAAAEAVTTDACLLYTSPSPRDISGSRMPSSA